MFAKVLVANRGEIAVRIFRTLRDLGDRLGRGVLRRRTGLRCIRGYADEAYALGGDTSARATSSSRSCSTAAGARARRRCIPGTASWPRTPRFARAVEAAGLVWIGPPPAAIELMGSKTRARSAMQAAGVPIIPGTTDPVGSAAEVVALGEEIGYPLLIKAAAGGGGKGMKVVRRASRRRHRRFESAQREGLSYFADASVYVEKLPRGSAARRGAGARGRARQRRPSRRARLHDPAPAPEAGRGDAVPGSRRRAARADRRDRGRRRARVRATARPGRSRGCSHATAPTTSWR